MMSEGGLEHRVGGPMEYLHPLPDLVNDEAGSDSGEMSGHLGGDVSAAAADAKMEQELRRPMRYVTDWANVYKSFVGSNFLGTPFAMLNAGVIAGVLGTGVIGLVTLFCCLQLIQVKNAFDDRRALRTYGDVAQRIWGRPGLLLINVALVFTQFGFCVGYLIYMAQNLQCMVMSYIPISNELVYLCTVIAPCVLLIPVCFVKRVEHLGPTSMLANGFLLVGIVMVFVAFLYEFIRGCPACREVQLVNTNISLWKEGGGATGGFPLFFGIMTASFEGIGLVLPVEATMSVRPRRYPMILVVVVLTVAVLLGGFGLSGYLAYGDGTEAVITTTSTFVHSMPTPFVKLVQACMIVAIFFTYPMQMFPVTEILDLVFWKKPSTSLVAPLPNLIRILCVALTGAIAFAMPKFGLIAGLVGALGSSFLAFIFPSIFHFIVYRRKQNVVRSALDLLIVLFGFVVMVIGTVFAVKDIVFYIIDLSTGKAHYGDISC